MKELEKLSKLIDTKELKKSFEDDCRNLRLEVQKALKNKDAFFTTQNPNFWPILNDCAKLIYSEKANIEKDDMNDFRVSYGENTSCSFYLENSFGQKSRKFCFRNISSK